MMRSRLSLAGTLAAIVVTSGLVAGGCGGSPTVTPPVVTNTPPIIESLAIGTRAEADQPIQIAAAVKDAETPLSQLTYTWSASPQSGLFSGNSVSGSQALITWRPPKGQKTPDVYTITLTVTESYTSGGQAKQNIVSSSTTVPYNDSPKELGEMGLRFLGYFANSAISAQACLIDFNDSCRGKADELGDIEFNRAHYTILSHTFGEPRVTYVAGNSSAEVLIRTAITSRIKSCDGIPSPCTVNAIEDVLFDAYLPSVYEQGRWWLCSSNAFGITGGPSMRFFFGPIAR
jgi:hypothetical protein